VAAGERETFAWEAEEDVEGRIQEDMDVMGLEEGMTQDRGE
jgi:hypothetical protein